MLTTEYDSVPSHCTIDVCGELIFDSVVSRNIELIKGINSFDQFTVKVTKKGKTLDLVDENQRQELVVQRITLNGIDLKIKEFGQFFATENSYIDDHLLQTNELFLNGKWSFELPARDINGAICDKRLTLIKDKFADCEVACFGCSQTYGNSLENTQSWPYQLRMLTNKSVMNYGVPGASINEIFALVELYLKDHHAENVLLFLPHTLRRQIIEDGKPKNLIIEDSRNRNLVFHGEEHSVASISGSFCSWLNKISVQTNVSFSSYHRNEFDLFQKTDLKKFMFPYLENNNYPKASDGEHNGAEFNQDLAKIVYNFLQDR